MVGYIYLLYLKKAHHCPIRIFHIFHYNFCIPFFFFLFGLVRLFAIITYATSNVYLISLIVVCLLLLFFFLCAMPVI